MKRTPSFILTALVALLVATACSSVIESAISSAGRTAGRTVGEAAGRAVGQHIVRTYTPRFAHIYASYMFNYAFTPGGYWVETVPYQEGDWTRWKFIEDGQETGSWIERAFLKKTDTGEQWWRVEMYDADSEDTVIIEALFDAERSEVLRMRGKFPDQEASEMAVEEGTTAVFADPIDLTDESIEGATVETGRVSVEAGTYTARHVRYGDMASGGTVEWWLVDDVPGGYVKYGTSSARSTEEDVEGLDSYNFTLELVAEGDNATTRLGSYR